MSCSSPYSWGGADVPYIVDQYTLEPLVECQRKESEVPMKLGQETVVSTWTENGS
jgi:hypothetical protein